MYGLFVVSAPSGAGKSTLCSRLIQELTPALRLSISSTSRAPRGNEQHGTHYFFLSPEEFKLKISQNLFAEWALVHGNYYGTSIETIRQFWAEKSNVLLDIDVQGAESLKKLFPRQCYTIFILPPSLEILEHRLRGRGTDREEVIQKRLENAKFEMAQKEKFDLQIMNDDFELAYAELKRSVLEQMRKWESQE